MNKNNWSSNGDSFYIRDNSSQETALPKAVFKVEFDPDRGFFLLKDFDNFDFPEKVYGIEEEFINRVVKTYKNTTSNLGILLNGVKGTGKSHTAKLICNKMDMPVILIDKDQRGLMPFLNSIPEEVIIFFDEFEKVFLNDNNKDTSAQILMMMDGATKAPFRRMFLLTTNKTYINENFMERPSRIRYVKEFNSLSVEAIEEIMDDKLKYPKFKDDLFEFFKDLNIVTMDIVVSAIEEVNIHKESPKKFYDFFNIQFVEQLYDVYEIINGEEKIYKRSCKFNIAPEDMDEDNIGESFRINGRYIGDIAEEVVDNEGNPLPNIFEIGYDESKRKFRWEYSKTSFYNIGAI